MIEPNWKTAPEGATHYDCRPCVSPAFMRKNHNGSDWEFFGNGHWIMYGYIVDSEAAKLIARPKPWSGEGLPPVGTVCEFRVEQDDWRQCEVIAHKDEYAVCWIHCNKVLTTIGFCLRPIRTPEQIKADERLHQVRNALTAIHAGDKKFPNDLVRGNIIAATVEAMIDAGYRKFEITDDSDPA